MLSFVPRTQQRAIATRSTVHGAPAAGYECCTFVAMDDPLQPSKEGTGNHKELNSGDGAGAVEHLHDRLTKHS